MIILVLIALPGHLRFLPTCHYHPSYLFQPKVTVLSCLRLQFIATTPPPPPLAMCDYQILGRIRRTNHLGANRAVVTGRMKLVQAKLYLRIAHETSPTWQEAAG